MPRPRLQFDLRWLIIAVALAALNMPLVVTALKCYPRRRFMPMIVIEGTAKMITTEDGSFYIGSSRNSAPPRLVNGPRRPTHLKIWRPVIASGTVSLILLFASARILRPRT